MNRTATSAHLRRRIRPGAVSGAPPFNSTLWLRPAGGREGPCQPPAGRGCGCRAAIARGEDERAASWLGGRPPPARVRQPPGRRTTGVADPSARAWLGLWTLVRLGLPRSESREPGGRHGRNCICAGVFPSSRASSDSDVCFFVVENFVDKLSCA
ncbi:hypothetical protein GQ55_5G436700 [Panicum hallii var. hallii]|uniref:Uncharacterized protein n=1 Tax=Panicum hallii var. hallii TaxID=1504633 RepID=A0A2T7DPI6_9POAL|nr:hypothetical protein GQ55_5G436700 [Panicum hallii var. hallii]